MGNTTSERERRARDALVRELEDELSKRYARRTNTTHHHIPRRASELLAAELLAAVSLSLPKNNEPPPSVSTNACLEQQQMIPSNYSAFMTRPVANNHIMNHQAHHPRPPSVANSEDLNLLLIAVKQAQTNLLMLQPRVARLGDPMLMEDIANAFNIAVSSAKSVRAADLLDAYALLNKVWERIRKLEDRLEQGRLGPPCSDRFAQSAHDVPLQAPSVVSPNGTHIPLSQWKKRMVSDGSVEMNRIITPPGGPSPSLSPVGCSVGSDFLPPLNKDDPEVIMKRLNYFMKRTQKSQKRLQVRNDCLYFVLYYCMDPYPINLLSFFYHKRWDRKLGLPKSHSSTMINSGRSRMQLQRGVILKKWTGDPLISSEKKS